LPADAVRATHRSLLILGTRVAPSYDYSDRRIASIVHWPRA